MQFLLLLIVNIFIGAVIYLVISLKLERTASEFREKKLRKEMDEIIKEFNSTASRNISLLENRISIIKRLLERTNELKSIDITVDDEGNRNQDLRINNVLSTENESVPFTKDEKKIIGKTEVPWNIANIKKSLIIFSKRSIDIIHEKKNIFARWIKDNSPKDVNTEETKYLEAPEGFNNIKSENTIDITIGKNISDSKDILKNIPISDNKETESNEEKKKLSDKEIYEMFASSSDKYSLIEDLYKNGYSMEVISRQSGIPAGEVRLVLNLRASQKEDTITPYL